MAQWCRQSGLDVQQAAHWQRVLQWEPDNALARAALGHRRAEGGWVTPEQVSLAHAEAVALRASLRIHGKNLLQLTREMLQGSQAERQRAVDKFLAIDSIDAVPAVAAVFASTPRPLIDHAVAWLNEVRDPSAAVVLARWSVDHPAEPVRDLCTKALKRRPHHQYVPLLLDRLRTPLVSTLIPSFRADGSLAGLRHVFPREGKDQFDVAVLDTVNLRQLRIVTPERDRTAPPVRMNRMEFAVERAVRQRDQQELNALNDLRVRAEAARAASQRELLAAAENRATETVNERIRIVLCRAAGTPPNATLTELWDWWSSYNEREPAPMKLASYSYRMNLDLSSAYAVSPPPRPSCECFVAGTSVITARGEKPIESLVVGDQVLSKNIETGELVWDVVLTTTVQPAKPLVEVTTDNDDFRCTGGHLFWVSGKGWTKASDLNYGDLLHGLSRPSLVRSIATADAAPTYNLVTAEHHNYFVGAGRAMTHDFNERRPTAARVPGLALALDDSSQ